MQIPILIEPIALGRFRARAGEPFMGCAEGDTASEAARSLQQLLAERVQNGAQYAMVNVPNANTESSIYFSPLPDDDWFFRTMREEIEKNRHLEDEASE